MNPQRIMDMACAFYDACVLFRAVEAGVFAHLAQTGPAGAAEVASACRLNPRAARLLLDACAALELVEKDGDTYRNSPEAETFLVPGSPADLSGALAYNRDVYPLWGRLDEFLKTGRPVERPEVHLGGDPERTRAFVMAMHSRALAIGRDINGRGALAHFDELGAYRVLSLVEDREELEGFAAEVLGELVEDDATTDDLRHTLQVLLESGGNVAEAARRLHFHYNTLRYRIDKLSSIVGPFMTDARVRLDVQLALLVHAMRGVDDRRRGRTPPRDE